MGDNQRVLWDSALLQRPLIRRRVERERDLVLTHHHLGTHGCVSAAALIIRPMTRNLH